MSTRLERLRLLMAEQDLPALLVTKRENIVYLSGFRGSAGALIVTGDQQLLLSDFRYQLQAATQAPGWTFVLATETLPGAIRHQLSALGVPRVGMDPDDLTVSHLERLGGDDTTLPYRFVPAPGLVEKLRLTKDADELARIREAVRITDGAYQQVVSLAAPGVTEWELVLEAEFYMRRHGAQGAAFDIIIAAGAHSALPHAQSGPHPLQPGDLVVVDMGARYGDYCADMTRTFAVAEATPLARETYRICWEAQVAGVTQLRAGMTGREVDTVVREVIDRAGYGAYFGHGTGHGVGLEVHEAPRLSRLSDEVLPVGAVVTVEPGIYLPDVGGVRIEDLVVLTDNGAEVLTGTPKPAELPVY